MYKNQLHGRVLACFYAFYLVIAGTLCLFMTPPFQVPDEPNHFLRALQIEQGDVFVHRRSPTEVGEFLPQSLLDMSNTFYGMPLHANASVTADDFCKAFHLKWDSAPVFVNLWNTSIYPPSSYIGSIAAISIARHIHVTPLATFYLARLGNLVVDGLIGIIALLLAQEAGGLILLILMFPSSIALISSCSQDGMIVALSALVVGCLLRLSKDVQQDWNSGIALILAIALGCMAAGKPPYLALLALVWLFGSRQNLKPVMWVSAISFGIFLFWAAFGLRGASVSAAIVRPGVSPAGQISFMLHHKLHAIYLFSIGTILNHPTAQNVVSLLGWSSTAFSHAFYRTTYFVCGFIFVNSFFLLRKPALFSKQVLVKLILFSGISFVVYNLIFLALYITWTLVGMNVVQGVQGRYLLPIFMTFALLPRIVCTPASQGLYARYFAPRLELFILFAFMLYSIHGLYSALSAQYW